MEQRNRLFYRIKPLIPRPLQLFVRRALVRYQAGRCKNIWPIDERAGAAPAKWSGWPEGKQFALVLTHDVDTARGYERCLDLAAIEERLGFRSSFNFVPLRYCIDEGRLNELRNRGFEVGVHGLYHDGKYYDTREVFLDRAQKINQYLDKWGCAGYRAPCMLHKLDWFHDLNIEYDASTFDTDPFEPNPCAAGTIFPFIVSCEETDRHYVEIPYTLPQDFTLFILMRQRNTDIWKRKLDWVALQGGVALMNTHPDYMNMSMLRCGSEEYPVEHYEQFLHYVLTNYRGRYWHTLPRELARFWKTTARDEQHDARAMSSLQPNGAPGRSGMQRPHDPIMGR